MSALDPHKAVLATAALAVASLFAPPAHAICGGQYHQNDCGANNVQWCCPGSVGTHGNCTWWAWEAACRYWQYPLPPHWGNAMDWAGNAAGDPHFDVLGSPVVSSIASAGPGYFGSVGHVAYVEAVNGGSVKVSEEGCKSGGWRESNYPSSRFTTGFIVIHGSECICADGDKQTEACSTCGTHARTCHACSWGSWGACEGPAEVCDGVDNDCNGQVDDGNPQQFGPVLPEYAATRVDASYPPALTSGEHAVIWADFLNSGAATWPKGGIWLGARGALDAAADAAPMSSQLAPGTWPAWNVAAVLDHAVPPGEIGRFTFEVTAPDLPGAQISEKFQLQVPGGAFIACPTADLDPTIRVMPGGGGGAGGAPSTAAKAGRSAAAGCSAAPSNQGYAGAALLSLALLSLARARRGARAGRGSFRG